MNSKENDKDLNEEFKCCNCVKNVSGRFLFCSQKCEDEFWKKSNEDDRNEGEEK